MGIDIFLVTKTRRDDRIYQALSRDFRDFVGGPDQHGDRCELRQLEQLFNLQLEPLTQYTALSPPTDELEYELWQAEEAADERQAAALRQEITRVSQQWHTDYDQRTAGWTLTIDMQTAATALLERIIAHPDYHLNLQHTSELNGYFVPAPKTNAWQERLHFDLQYLLELLEQAQTMGEQYVTFDFS
jgi:hypothetical protein